MRSKFGVGECSLSTTDRALLRHRILKKVSGVRRGRLYLPQHFPAEVRALSNLTTGQLRETVYRFRASDSHSYRLDEPVRSFAQQVFPAGQIRTMGGSFSVHCSQARKAKSLRASDWPRLGTRSAWPSSPTVIELLAMSRKGESPIALQTKGNAANRRIHLSEFNSDAELRARVVATNIVGLRSDIKLPNRWLDYFRYRWNFLILAVPYDLPTGLVRYLTGQWIRNPHNLWLRDKCTFKTFLKINDRSRFPCGRPGPW